MAPARCGPLKISSNANGQVHSTISTQTTKKLQAGSLAEAVLAHEGQRGCLCVCV